MEACPLPPQHAPPGNVLTHEELCITARENCNPITSDPQGRPPPPSICHRLPAVGGTPRPYFCGGRKYPISFSLASARGTFLLKGKRKKKTKAKGEKQREKERTHLGCESRRAFVENKILSLKHIKTRPMALAGFLTLVHNYGCFQLSSTTSSALLSQTVNGMFKLFCWLLSLITEVETRR